MEGLEEEGAMVDQSAIERQVIDYLRGHQSLDAFGQWLAVATWDVPPEDTTGVRALAGAIELALAEFDDGSLDIARLRSRLALLISNHDVLVSADAAPQVRTGVSSATALYRLDLPA